jgi:hypothetical protein
MRIRNREVEIIGEPEINENIEEVQRDEEREAAEQKIIQKNLPYYIQTLEIIDYQ